MLVLSASTLARAGDKPNPADETKAAQPTATPISSAADTPGTAPTSGGWGNDEPLPPGWADEPEPDAAGAKDSSRDTDSDKKKPEGGDDEPETTISGVRYAVGGVLGTYVGFGLGHTVSHEWQSAGYIFTAGEASAIALIVISASQAESSGGAAAMGFLAFLGLRVWEIYDIWTRPSIRGFYRSDDDARHEAAKMRWVALPFLAKGVAGVAASATF